MEPITMMLCGWGGKTLLAKILGTAAISATYGVINSGRNKNDGGHDHRTNRGKDRTPAQKSGDEARSGTRSVVGSVAAQATTHVLSTFLSMQGVPSKPGGPVIL